MNQWDYSHYTKYIALQMQGTLVYSLNSLYVIIHKLSLQKNQLFKIRIEPLFIILDIAHCLTYIYSEYNRIS